MVDGKIVRSATGHNDNRMRLDAFDVREWEAKTARLEIVDRQTGPWGNIGVGRIVMTDQPSGKLDEQPDFGTMAIALLEPRPDDQADCDMFIVPGIGRSLGPGKNPVKASEPLGTNPHAPVAALTRSMSLEPGQEATATYVIAWHFPNLSLKDGGRYYANRFVSAGAVAEYVAENFDRLAAQTRLWHDTWYDSTLPYWFLDRTLLERLDPGHLDLPPFPLRAASTAGKGSAAARAPAPTSGTTPRPSPGSSPNWSATFASGPTSAWPSTTTRASSTSAAKGGNLAIDGQAGCILRSYREHQMSADDAFLRRNWPKIKKAIGSA